METPTDLGKILVLPLRRQRAMCAEIRRFGDAYGLMACVCVLPRLAECPRRIWHLTWETIKWDCDPAPGNLHRLRENIAAFERVHALLRKQPLTVVDDVEWQHCGEPSNKCMFKVWLGGIWVSFRNTTYHIGKDGCDVSNCGTATLLTRQAYLCQRYLDTLPLWRHWVMPLLCDRYHYRAPVSLSTSAAAHRFVRHPLFDKHLLWSIRLSAL